MRLILNLMAADAALGALDEIIHVPLDQFRDRIETLPSDRPVVIVCRSGRRSSLAVKVLQSSRGMEVANLHGGMIAWRKMSARR